MIGPFPSDIVYEGTNFTKYFEKTGINANNIAAKDERKFDINSILYLTKKKAPVFQGDGYRLITLDEFKRV